MLSTHGRSGIRLWDLGSVAEKVIHVSKVPVWLVPSELREEIIYDIIPQRTMVIPLDGSKLSEAVIPYAINIAKQRGAETEMVLIHIENLITPNSSDQWKRQEGEVIDKKKYLEGIVKRIGEGGIKARAELLMGNPAETIVNFVKDNPAQLIAMATHGHAGISRMIFGNVTENILHLLKKTPIFLVRPLEMK